MMLSRTVLLILSLSLLAFSCGGVHEEGSEVDSISSLIAQELNSKNLSAAESLIAEAKVSEPDSLLIKYYESQLFSLKAGIDIYSLFPIVKMELFEFAMTEWGQIEDFNKKNQTDVQDTILGNSVTSESIDVLKKFLEEYKQTEPEKIEYDAEITLSYAGQVYESSFFDAQTSQTITQSEIGCSYKIEITIKDEVKGIKIHDYPYKSFIDTQACPESINYKLPPPAVVKDRFIREITKTIDKKKSRTQTKKYLKASFALFESVGIISKVPSFDVNNLKYVLMAIESLTLVHNESPLESRLHTNSKQQLGLLGGFLILASLKDSIDVDRVEDPTDFLCLANGEVLFSKGPLLLEGVKVLATVSNDTEFAKKNKKSLDSINEKLVLAEEQGIDNYFESQEKKDEFVDDLEDLKSDNCVL